MRIISLLLLLMFSAAASAQILQLYDPVSNKVFNVDKYSGIRGTPFLVDKWIKGNVITNKGIYENLELKLDAYDNILYFNKDDQSFELTDNIVGFTLMPKPNDTTMNMRFRRGISGSGLKPEQYVQIIFEGKLKLYKSDIKALSEMSEINAGIVKTFATTSRYYIVKDNVAHLVKMNKSDILPLLSDQQEKIQAYIDERKLSLKKEAELYQVIVYYNQL